MAYSNQLREALNQKDVRQARNAIQVELALKDPNAREPKALKDAMAIVSFFPGQDLFVPDDGCLPFLPKTEWNPEYFRRIRAALITNFSKEKLERADAVIKYLREQGNPDFQIKSKKKETGGSHPFPQTEPDEDETSAPDKTSRGEGNGNKKSNGDASRAKENNPLPAILLGAAIGGGTGLVIGLLAGITLKATICGGILAGGIAGAIVNRTKNDR